MSSSESEGENVDFVPDTMKEVARNVTLDLLPTKSKMIYTAAYNIFKKWRKENGSNSFCEDVLLAYFAHLSTKYVPPSLWSTYSMLKAAIKVYNNINIADYMKLMAFLKKKSVGYRPKKSLIFTSNDISRFFNEAPDHLHLLDKVVLIFGIYGDLRREEFTNILQDDVKKLENEDVLLININKTKNYVPRSFTIAGPLFDICWQYIQARPTDCEIKRFFLRFSKGKCCKQAVGINKFATVPKDIATYLNLPDTDNYTGHCFRRTSATLLVDAGADLTTLKRHGGWKSSTVASGYIADSLNNKKKISNQIGSEIVTNKRAKIDDTVPVSVKENFASNSTSATLPKESKQAETIDIFPDTETEIHYAPSTSITTAVPAPSKEKPVAVSHSGPTIKNIQELGTKIVVAPSTSKKIPSAGVLRSIENINASFNNLPCQRPTTNKVFNERQELSLPIHYNPDIGLYVLGSSDETRPTYIFNNCNVTINSVNSPVIDVNCIKLDKAVQTEKL